MFGYFQEILPSGVYNFKNPIRIEVRRLEKNKVARENHLFFIAAVGMVMTMQSKNFILAVLQSSKTPTLYGIERINMPGYIRIDSTDIELNCSSGSLRADIQNGILGRVAMKLPEAIRGDLNTEAEVIYNNYKFSFNISSYERDSAHGFETVTDLASLPPGEKLGRLVDLKITIER